MHTTDFQFSFNHQSFHHHHESSSSTFFLDSFFCDVRWSCATSFFTLTFFLFSYGHLITVWICNQYLTDSCCCFCCFMMERYGVERLIRESCVLMFRLDSYVWTPDWHTRHEIIRRNSHLSLNLLDGFHRCLIISECFNSYLKHTTHDSDTPYIYA